MELLQAGLKHLDTLIGQRCLQVALQAQYEIFAATPSSAVIPCPTFAVWLREPDTSVAQSDLDLWGREARNASGMRAYIEIRALKYGTG